MGLFRRSSPTVVHPPKTTPIETTIKPTIKPYSIEKKIISQETYIKNCVVAEMTDFDLVKQDLERGHIIVINMEEILSNREIDILDVKRAVERIRGFCIEKGGNIGRIGENFLIITPNGNFGFRN